MRGKAQGHEQVSRSYDEVAAAYAGRFSDELAAKPFDRDLLARFAARAEAPCADLGCGPGHVAAHLADLGLVTQGLDLSPAMVAEARRRHPGLSFAQADFLDLSAWAGHFGAAVAFYSLIHLDPEEVPAALRQVRDLLRPGGQLLVAVHEGDGAVHRDDWFDRPVNLDFTLFGAEQLADLLAGAGFEEVERHRRPPYPEETTTRLYHWVRRPGAGGAVPPAGTALLD